MDCCVIVVAWTVVRLLAAYMNFGATLAAWTVVYLLAAYMNFDVTLATWTVVLLWLHGLLCVY